jgi:hypothetical protein
MTCVGRGVLLLTSNFPLLCVRHVTLTLLAFSTFYLLFGAANKRNMSGHVSIIKISVFVFQTNEIMHTLLIQCPYCNTRKFFEKPA